MADLCGAQQGKLSLLAKVKFKEELNAENRDWLKLSETAFVFWDNEEDAYYDDL